MIFCPLWAVEGAASSAFKRSEADRGVIATYQSEPILAVYHSTSGGRTENSEHYWAKPCPTCVPWRTLFLRLAPPLLHSAFTLPEQPLS